MIREREKQTFGSILGIITSVIMGVGVIIKSSLLYDKTQQWEGVVGMWVGVAIALIGGLFFGLCELSSETKYQQKVRGRREEEVQRLKSRSGLKK